MTHICKCNNCNHYLYDTNPQVGAIDFDDPELRGEIFQIDKITGLDELIIIDDMKACPHCMTDEYLTDIEI